MGGLSMDKKKRVNARKGFTLIELLVAMAIVAIMAVAIVPNIFSYIDKAKVTAAKNDVRTLSTALGMYKVDNGFYPSTEQGLQALVVQPSSDPVPMSWNPSGYITGSTLPNDPWGHPYVYRSPAENGDDFEIISRGADNKDGGEGYNADIKSTELR